jgi:hypothetical protein
MWNSFEEQHMVDNGRLQKNNTSDKTKLVDIQTTVITQETHRIWRHGRAQHSL